jgi:RPA family protein
MTGKTGPTSSAGKTKVSRNAVKHGLRASKWLSPEEQSDFAALAADLHDEYQPSSATQRILVERIAMCMSKLRRLHAIEDALFHKARIGAVEIHHKFHANEMGTSIEEIQASAMPNLKQVDVLARYQTTLDRQLSKAIGELMVLKANAPLMLPAG